jgi:hypothetical protein
VWQLVLHLKSDNAEKLMLFINDPLLAAYISLEILTIVITGKC